MAINNEGKTLVISEYPNAFKRQGAFPLDTTSVQYTEAELRSYAGKTGDDALSYIGQIVTCKEGSNEIETFVINNTQEQPGAPLLTKLVRESDLRAAIDALDSDASDITNKTATRATSNDSFITGLVIENGKITKINEASNAASANKTNIYLLSADDLTEDTVAGLKGVYVNTSSLTLNNKDGVTAEDGYADTASLTSNFTGVRAHRYESDTVYMGVDQHGDLQTLYYNNGTSAHGFVGPHVFKSYENGTPRFNSVSFNDTASINSTEYTGNAATATNATNDSLGQAIASNYIKHLSVSGRTITYTKGDDTTGSITTQDTTYSFGTGDSQGQYKVSGTNYSVNGLSTSSSPTFSSVTASTFYALSDKRLKTNISPVKLHNSILDLPVYKFDYIDGKKNIIGCIAQDMQEFFPELVTTNSSGYLTIEETKIVYLLLEEVKKLKTEIYDLRCKLEGLS